MESNKRASRPTAHTMKTTYCFSHVLVQEAVYKMLLNQKLQFHQWVAEWYEKNIEDLSPYSSLLAKHYSRANNLKRTLHFSLSAGDSAFNKSCYDEAIDFFLAAIRLAEISRPSGNDAVGLNTGIDPVTFAGIRRKLAECYINYGELKDATFHLEQALYHLKQPLPNTGSTSFIGELLVHGWRRYKPTTSTTFGITRDILEIVRTYEKLGEFYCLKAEDPSKPVFAILRAINLAESAKNPPAELAICYGYMIMLSNITSNFGSLPAMYDGLLQSIMARRSSGATPDPSSENCIAKGLCIASTYYVSIGNFQKADLYLSQSLQINERVGNRSELARTRLVLAYLHFLTGKIEDSEKMYKTVNLASQSGDVESKTMSRLGRTQITVLRDKTREALETLEEIEPTVPNILRPMYYGLLCNSYFRSGRTGLAIEIANVTIEELLSSKPYFTILESSFWTLEVILAVWEIDTSSKLITSDLKNKTKTLMNKIDSNLTKVPITKPKLMVYKGLLEWILGNFAKAEKRWIEALSIANEMHLKFDVALATFEMERHYCFTTKYFRRKTDDSHSLFESMGIPVPYRPRELEDISR